MLDPPHPLVAKNDINIFSRTVLTPHAPLALGFGLGLGGGVSLGMSAIGDAGVGCWGEGGFGVGLGAFFGGWGGGAVFSLGGWWVFLSRTCESAKQAEDLELREEREEEEEESVEDSEECSEEESPASLFLFFGGVWKGLWVLAWHLFCFAGRGLFCPGGSGLFWARGQVLGPGRGAGGGGGAHELLAVGGGSGQAVNAAPALHLHLSDATTAGQMVGQGRQHLQCCNWLQVQLLHQGAIANRPGVASRPAHDEAHRPQFAEIDLHILDLARG